MRVIWQRAFVAAFALGLPLFTALTTGRAQAPAEPADAGAAPSGAEKMETKKFDEWHVTCSVPKGTGKKICQSVQTLTNNKDGKRVMQTMVGYSDNNADPLMIFILPLGYLLPSGAQLSLDGKEIRALGAERCLSTGCIVPLRLDKDMLEKFKAGTAGKLAIKISKDQAVDLPFVLKGFSAALLEVRQSATLTK